MNEKEILKWAAGSTKVSAAMSVSGPPDEQWLQLVGVDQERLVSLLEWHRLAQRFLWRYGEERPRWCNRSLLSQIAFLQRRAQTKMRRQIAAVQEIQAALPPRKSPLLILKGFSTYALTGNLFNLHGSSDLDLSYDNLELLWNVLSKLGYIGKRLFGHEYGHMTRGDIKIDIHEYFPVYSYPEGLIMHDLQHHQNVPVVQHGPMSLKEYRLYYEDFCQELTNGKTPETSDLTFLQPTFLVLLLCAHQFKNCVTSLHYMGEHHRTVRLAELMDIAELTKQADFDVERLMDLRNVRGGGSSIDLALHLLDFYGMQIPSTLKGHMAERTVFPEHLPWGGWITIDSEEDWLESRDPKRTVVAMGARTTPISDFNNVKTEWLSKSNTPNRIISIMPTLTESSCEAIRIASRIWHDEEYLHLEFLRFQTPSQVRGDSLILVRFNYDVWAKLKFNASAADLEHQGLFSTLEQASIHTQPTNAGTLLHLQIPIENLPHNMRREALACLVAFQDVESSYVEYWPMLLRVS